MQNTTRITPASAAKQLREIGDALHHLAGQLEPHHRAGHTVIRDDFEVDPEACWTYEEAMP